MMMSTLHLIRGDGFRQAAAKVFMASSSTFSGTGRPRDKSARREREGKRRAGVVGVAGGRGRREELTW